MNLECDEKILTGEAVPVAKDVKFDSSNLDEVSTGAGDRLNMAYSSSTVTKGRGKGVVVFTGMYTEIGRIAASMQGKQRKANRSLSNKESKIQPAKGLALRTWDGIGAFLGLTVGTPLQKKLSKLAYVLFGCAILLAIIVFGVNRFIVTNEVAIYAISTGKFIMSGSDIGLTSSRHRHHPRVPHCRIDHHHGCGYDTNAKEKSCHPSIECFGGSWWCHEYLFRQDRDTDAGPNDYKESLDSWLWYILGQ